VKKGQLLLKVRSPDVSGAFDIYLKAANDERMANLAYVRAKDLFEHGAISQAMLEQAEDTEKDAQADLTAALQTACDAQRDGVTTFIEVILNQELGEPFRRDAMKKPVAVAGIRREDMRPQQTR